MAHQLYFTEDELAKAFIKKYNILNKTNFRVSYRPDTKQQKVQTCDFICNDFNSHDMIAMEVTSITTSSSSMEQNQRWLEFMEKVEGVLKDKMSGAYYVATSESFPSASDDPTQFSEELIRQIQKSNQQKRFRFTYTGNEVLVASLPSETPAFNSQLQTPNFVIFSRSWFSSDAQKISDSIEAVITELPSKFRRFHDDFIPTFWIFHNTFLAELGDEQIGSIIKSHLDALKPPDRECIEKVFILSGSFPTNCWINDLV